MCGGCLCCTLHRPPWRGCGWNHDPLGRHAAVQGTLQTLWHELQTHGVARRSLHAVVGKFHRSGLHASGGHDAPSMCGQLPFGGCGSEERSSTTIDRLCQVGCKLLVLFQRSVPFMLQVCSAGFASQSCLLVALLPPVIGQGTGIALDCVQDTHVKERHDFVPPGRLELFIFVPQLAKLILCKTCIEQHPAHDDHSVCTHTKRVQCCSAGTVCPGCAASQLANSSSVMQAGVGVACCCCELRPLPVASSCSGSSGGGACWRPT